MHVFICFKDARSAICRCRASRDTSQQSATCKTYPESDASSLCFVIVAPVLHFGATVMECFLNRGDTAHKKRRGRPRRPAAEKSWATEEGLFLLVRLVLSSLQVKALVSLALVCLRYPFVSTASYRCRVDYTQPTRALRKYSLGF